MLPKHDMSKALLADVYDLNIKKQLALDRQKLRMAYINRNKRAGAQFAATTLLAFLSGGPINAAITAGISTASLLGKKAIQLKRLEKVNKLVAKLLKERENTDKRARRMRLRQDIKSGGAQTVESIVKQIEMGTAAWGHKNYDALMDMVERTRFLRACYDRIKARHGGKNDGGAPGFKPHQEWTCLDYVEAVEDHLLYLYIYHDLGDFFLLFATLFEHMDEFLRENMETSMKSVLKALNAADVFFGTDKESPRRERERLAKIEALRNLLNKSVNTQKNKHRTTKSSPFKRQLEAEIEKEFREHATEVHQARNHPSCKDEGTCYLRGKVKKTLFTPDYSGPDSLTYNKEDPTAQRTRMLQDALHSKYVFGHGKKDLVSSYLKSPASLLNQHDLEQALTQVNKLAEQDDDASAVSASETSQSVLLDILKENYAIDIDVENNVPLLTGAPGGFLGGIASSFAGTALAEADLQWLADAGIDTLIKRLAGSAAEESASTLTPAQMVKEAAIQTFWGGYKTNLATGGVCLLAGLVGPFLEAYNSYSNRALLKKTKSLHQQSIRHKGGLDRMSALGVNLRQKLLSDWVRSYKELQRLGEEVTKNELQSCMNCEDAYQRTRSALRYLRALQKFMGIQFYMREFYDGIVRKVARMTSKWAESTLALFERLDNHMAPGWNHEHCATLCYSDIPYILKARRARQENGTDPQHTLRTTPELNEYIQKQELKRAQCHKEIVDELKTLFDKDDFRALGGSGKKGDKGWWGKLGPELDMNEQKLSFDSLDTLSQATAGTPEPTNSQQQQFQKDDFTRPDYWTNQSVNNNGFQNYSAAKTPQEESNGFARFQRMASNSNTNTLGGSARSALSPSQNTGKFKRGSK